MRIKVVCILLLLCLVSFSACRHNEGPNIDELLPFKDAEVVSIEYLYRTAFLHITKEEHIESILNWMRALEPISYNYEGIVRNGYGANFVFHMTDGRLYHVCYSPISTSLRDACSFENDVVRINVPFDEMFLKELAGLVSEYENHFVPNEILLPMFGYSDPGDPPMREYPYFVGSTPRP